METTYPGVYIKEIPSGVRTIIGVSTSRTAFVGRALKGPVEKPILIHNFGDYTRLFGGLWDQSPMSFAVQQYFINGGSEAVIVRVANAALKATYTLTAGTTGTLVLEASSEGTWGNNLRVSVDHDTKDPAQFFNLTVSDTPPTGTGTGETETLRNLSVNSNAARFVQKVLEQESRFIRVAVGAGTTLPTSTPDDTLVVNGSNLAGPFTGGDDGGVIADADIAPAAGFNSKKGMYALEDTDIFNLLCLPPRSFMGADFVSADTYSRAATYCKDKRAFLLIDVTEAVTDPAKAKDHKAVLAMPLGLKTDAANHAAIFFPRVVMSNPLKNNLLQEFAPCGAIAGIFARNDAQRGVWKAPAGLEAGILGLQKLTYTLTDAENGDLNPLGINCLRNFKEVGPVIWGSRTLQGSDALASEWKYIPVRRTALYIEESLYRGTQWAVFEPNDEPLWAQIRLNLGAFMHDLFRQGAFQGSSPREAYFVKCDKETTTQSDINRGVVNILVGFAPLKPAEFVVIQIQQMAGQIQT